MTDKDSLIRALREEFERWEAILAGMSNAQVMALIEDSGWSTRDVLVHLWAWQQRSIARLEAALNGTDPDYPDWPTEFEPEVPEEPDDLNAWLHTHYRSKPWPQVYADWRTSYLDFIKLAEAVPEADLLAAGRYPWLEGYTLADVLDGAREHHAEHREWLTEWLEAQR
jgi:hypothetical protein